MRITYLLPLLPLHPIGGFSVHYRWANQLADRGHDVNLIHPRDSERLRRDWRARLGTWRWRREVRVSPIYHWFRSQRFHPRARVRLTPSLHGDFVPRSDVLVCTAWQTAEAAMSYPAAAGPKAYVIYDYEFWKTADDATRARMAATFRAGFRTVATSPAVVEMLAEVGVTPDAVVPCGMDLEAFGIDVPPETRGWTVGFPARPHPSKGLADAVTAAELLRQRLGDRLTVRAFGHRRPENLPAWIDFWENPDATKLRAFYNSVSVFLFPSHYEGWGLPGQEAQACGAALAAADSVGLRDYARPEETALLTPIRRPDLLAAAAERLLQDPALRSRLVTRAAQHTRTFTWERAVTGLEQVLVAAAAPSRA